MKWAILQRIGSDLSEPVAGISWGETEGEPGERLLLAFHRRDQLPEHAGVFVLADGVELLLSQDSLVEMLEGKVLDIIRGKLALITP